MVVHRPSGRARATSALWAVVFAVLISPAVALAANQSWTITHTPTTVTDDVQTPVAITVTNTSDGNGGGDSIGCVRIVIPSAFSVGSVVINSVSRGFSWSASTTGTGPTTVLLKAASDSNRLRGKPEYDVLRATITVTGNSPGGYTWTADEFEKPDCTQNQNLPRSLAVTITSAPTPPPTPPPTVPPTASPKPTASPTSTPIPSPTPAPNPGATPDVTPDATLEATPEATPEGSQPPLATPGQPGPPTAPPTTPAGLGTIEAFIVADTGSGPVQLANISLASALLGELDAFMWAVPGMALSVPGLIVVGAILGQAMGGLAWLPLARRKIGTFGFFGRGRRDPH